MNQERIYTVLREPLISEKVSVLGDLANQYAFKVAPDARDRRSLMDLHSQRARYERRQRSTWGMGRGASR